MNRLPTGGFNIVQPICNDSLYCNFSSEEGMEGGKPNVKRGSPKKKRSSRQHSKTSKASSKSAEESSDDEASQKTNKKGMNKKTAELIRKEQEKEDARMKQQVEEVKRNEEEKKFAAEKKKVELEQKKKVDEVKRKEEERKKVIALNDPKETAWMNFNDTLAEASGCFMRNIANRSMEKYGEALEMIARSFKDLKFKNKNVKTCDEVVVIKFMFARLVSHII